VHPFVVVFDTFLATFLAAGFEDNCFVLVFARINLRRFLLHLSHIQFDLDKHASNENRKQTGHNHDRRHKDPGSRDHHAKKDGPEPEVHQVSNTRNETNDRDRGKEDRDTAAQQEKRWYVQTSFAAFLIACSMPMPIQRSRTP
jgi:hypothetical protein